MQFPKLNLPELELRFTKNEKGTTQVFDSVRKKFVDVTPEEWVRQHFIHYLMEYKNVPLSMLSVEKQLLLNNTKRRTDIVVFSTSLKPLLIIECKAPNIPLTQETINQVLLYNIELKVPCIVVTNGNKHVAVNIRSNPIEVLTEIPSYDYLLSLV